MTENNIWGDYIITIDSRGNKSNSNVKTQILIIFQYFHFYSTTTDSPLLFKNVIVTSTATSHGYHLLDARKE